MSLVLCAGCREEFPNRDGGHAISTRYWPEGCEIFVCTGCSEAAIDPRHYRNREVLERLAAALRGSKEWTQRVAQTARRSKESQS